MAFAQARAPFELEMTMSFAPDCALEDSPAEDNAAVRNISHRHVHSSLPVLAINASLCAILVSICNTL